MSDANIINAQAQGTPLAANLMRSLAAPQLGALLVVATALTLGIGLIIWTMKPVFVPVGGQGGREDALQIIEHLTASQVEYKLDASTGLVLVPQDQAAQVQMSLAASGLNSGDRSQGLELLQEEPSLGTSHFTESARYQHALETELSRTISSMRNVDSARVHLAIPKQSVFIRDRADASASIMIKAKPGRSIEDEQVHAVINLVASSIPYLESGQVTVVDQWGRLLSTGDDSTDGATRDQYQYARKLEKLYSERIESLLTPIVGAGRIRAIVTADVDFTTNEQTQESYEPDAQQLRSEQVDTQVNRDGAGGAGGIPGALTNQPPGNGTVDPGLAEAGEAGANGIQNETSSAVRNYELDRTITHVRQAPGSIQRISAAVIIDDRLDLNEAGEPVRTPLTEDELAEYTRLAQEAVGFSEERGDSVVVFNRAFKPVEEILPIEPLPIWQQSWLWTMVRQVLIGLSVLLLVLLVLRPAVKRLVPVVDKQALAALQANQDNGALALHDPDNATETASKSGSKEALEPPSVIYGDILNMARAMAAEDPKRVAKVVKDWVAEQ
ncbi:flagellar basal-body MS-ring/collar protein FliF [Granulosicoccus antarcticus]|uniref:Flagellar M-ring protein n=1 Tax=Granulosicoccus antarcticus IMCC3135 TaxID=1192854 RepID=A0A2Z2NKV5_9GAMM|nr:flagellar basal-body MS-ring/collar protein FliF [Granulosicoccus antarcticus]ASJ71773.1 Flagellar M-ring protein [Granulosicoccus antarcticus IMCC3135]